MAGAGAWEGDLLVGHANASALGTLVERTTRFRLLVTLKAKDAGHRAAWPSMPPGTTGAA